MAKHICVYYDDGELETGCVCGERAVLVSDQDGVDVLVLMDARPCDEVVAA